MRDGVIELAYAMVERALMDLGRAARTNENRNPGRNEASALAWVQECSLRPFGFAWCCGLAGVDEDVARERILQWHAQADRGCAPGGMLPQRQRVQSPTLREGALTRSEEWWLT